MELSHIMPYVLLAENASFSVAASRRTARRQAFNE